MNHWKLYDPDIPDFLLPFLETGEMKRLKDVGMNCGVEYTSFPLFRDIASYSRYDHSLGCALLAWRFTKDQKQALACLFHDISTPCFAHSIDFMMGDYRKQEATEEKTQAVLKTSKEITALLADRNITLSDVSDYHRYPVCDNDSPKLSCDRLEYTLGNSLNFNFASQEDIKTILSDLRIAVNEEGEEEIQFSSYEPAELFCDLSMKCSHVYVSDPDRYSMQLIAECVKDALERKVIDMKDLYGEEKPLIGKLRKDKDSRVLWTKLTHNCRMIDAVSENSRVVDAKKRYIDPLVYQKGRMSLLDEEFRKEKEAFLALDFSRVITAEGD